MNKIACVGERASDFVLNDTRCKPWRLGEHTGRIVVLLFYPGDETLICTKQLCAVRDNWSRYMDTGAEVVGISPGSESEHYEFAMHHSLPMPLLADAERQVTLIYGKHPWLPIWSTRAVVVVDARGMVRFRSVMARVFRPTDDEVLSAIHLARYDRLAERRHAGIKDFA